MGSKGKRERDWGDRLARFSPSPLPFSFLRLPRRLVVGAPFNVGSYILPLDTGAGLHGSLTSCCPAVHVSADL